MWKKPEKPVPIEACQLVPGLYVWIDLPWDDHPFLYNRFKISDAKQIKEVQALKLAGHLYYYPEKSSAEPGPPPAPEAIAAAPITPSQAELENELQQEMARQSREKHERQQRLRAPTGPGNRQRG